MAGGLNLYGFAGGDPVNFTDPFGLSRCPPLCGPAGTYVRDAFRREIIEPARVTAENTVVYASVGGGMASGELQADLTGRAAARGGAGLSTQALGGAFGIRYEVSRPTSGSTEVTLTYGPDLGVVQLSLTTTLALSSGGSSQVTSVGAEVSVGASRTPGPVGASVAPQSSQGCRGSRCFDQDRQR